MFRIDCDNTMTVTRHDKAFISFRCGNYKLTQGDSVVFTIKGIDVIKTVRDIEEGGIACIDLDVSDTDHETGTYDYNIRVLTTLGVDETVIQGKFIITNGN